MNDTAQTGGEIAIDDEVAYAELFRMRARHWRTQISAAMLMTFILAWVFNSYAVDQRIWAWAGLICLNMLAQMGLCLWMERLPCDAAMPRTWWHITHALTIGVGLLWNSLAWLLPGADTRLQLLAAFASAMVAVAASSASNSTGLLLGIVIPGIVLIPTGLIWHAGIPVAGMVSVVLLVLLLQHGLSLQRVMLESIRLRHRAVALSEKLRIEQEKAQDVMRQQVMLNERQRVMRDLHDGLGSTLVSSLVALERGSMPASAMVEVLRECVDDSRIVIDSLEPIGHDLVVLLATMRHRLGPRLLAAGLNVRWEVQDLPALPWLGPTQALQVLRIVQETLTNVLKHAHANSVRIATRHTVDGGTERIVIVIEDNGVGFDIHARAKGRGLRHLESRARQLGATVDIHSEPGKGTSVRLTVSVV